MPKDRDAVSQLGWLACPRWWDAFACDQELARAVLTESFWSPGSSNSRDVTRVYVDGNDEVCAAIAYYPSEERGWRMEELLACASRVLGRRAMKKARALLEEPGPLIPEGYLFVDTLATFESHRDRGMATELMREALVHERVALTWGLRERVSPEDFYTRLGLLERSRLGFTVAMDIDRRM